MPIEAYGNNVGVIVARGPVVSCVVGLPIAQPQPQTPTPNIPTPDLHPANGLLDTGASNCCINPSLAKSLNLPIAGYRPSTDASGNTTQCIVRNGCFGLILRNSVVRFFPAVQFIELPKDLPNHTLIIGRNMMVTFRSMYFSFRTGEYMIHF
ncbi:MAG TPA: retropepsin-like aspartic protease [Chitinivibrionales bacterium]|nr:retropepsin-like aspartic protease [Chitinivibrionales bacterium]